MRKILIVEDDQLVANIYGNRFSHEGFQVKIAADGAMGLGLVHSFQPDAVILDLMLPRLSGVELTKRIRAEAGWARLPVIVFSNAYQTSMMDQAEKAGATKCVSKATAMPKQVVELVRSLLPADALPAGSRGASANVAGQARTSPASLAGITASRPATSGEPEVDFQVALRQSFVEGLPATLAALRTLLQNLIKAGDESARLAQIHELYRHVHALTGHHRRV